MRTLAAALVVLLAGCHPSVETGPAPDRSPSVETGAKDAPAMQTQKVSATPSSVGIDPGGVGEGTPLVPKAGHELAAFAAGCFWGVEDAFRKLPGVTATAVGYTGGHLDHPTYDRVCDHDTGHAETVLVEFDPQRISYAKLVKAFFQIHDPTTMNRQGPDEGDQYRSEIFTFSAAQIATAKAGIAEAQKRAHDPIVTKVEAIPAFWKAEDYHQQYAEKNGYHGCPTGKLDGLL